MFDWATGDVFRSVSSCPMNLNSPVSPAAGHTVDLFSPAVDAERY